MCVWFSRVTRRRRSCGDQYPPPKVCTDGRRKRGEEVGEEKRGTKETSSCPDTVNRTLRAQVYHD